MTLDTRFGLIGQQLGDDLEKRVEEVLTGNSYCWPKWFKKVRKTEKWSTEDMRGIDLVISTDCGPVLLQIKSSKPQARKFLFRHRCDRIKIIVVVIDIRVRDRVVFNHLIQVIQKRYNELWYETR